MEFASQKLVRNRLLNEIAGCARRGAVFPRGLRHACARAQEKFVACVERKVAVDKRKGHSIGATVAYRSFCHRFRGRREFLVRFFYGGLSGRVAHERSPIPFVPNSDSENKLSEVSLCSYLLRRFSLRDTLRGWKSASINVIYGSVLISFAADRRGSLEISYRLYFRRAVQMA